MPLPRLTTEVSKIIIINKTLANSLAAQEKCFVMHRSHYSLKSVLKYFTLINSGDR